LETRVFSRAGRGDFDWTKERRRSRPFKSKERGRLEEGDHRERQPLSKGGQKVAVKTDAYVNEMIYTRRKKI